MQDKLQFLLVRSQSFKWLAEKPTFAAVANKENLRIVQKLQKIGESSLSFTYEFYKDSASEGSIKFGIVLATLVVTRGGKKYPLSPEVQKLVPEIVVEPSVGEFVEITTTLSNTLFETDRDHIPISPLRSVDILPRPSDCDSNNHINHAVVAAFLEDYIHYFHSNQYETISIQYMREMKVDIDTRYKLVSDEKHSKQDGVLYTRLYIYNESTKLVHVRAFFSSSEETISKL